MCKTQEIRFLTAITNRYTRQSMDHSLQHQEFHLIPPALMLSEISTHLVSFPSLKGFLYILYAVICSLSSNITLSLQPFVSPLRRVMIFVYRLSRPLIAKGYIHNVEGYHICYAFNKHTVVNSTRDSIVYFTKDNIQNLFSE